MHINRRGLTHLAPANIASIATCSASHALVHLALPLPLFSLALLLLLAAASRPLRTARGLSGRRHGLRCILHSAAMTSACCW
jgi:hypothetical protein